MRRRCKPELVVVAALVYLPFLWSSPGRVSADSKQYLYLDPGAFLRRTLQLWDPSIGAGTVPHQHLGYAFPVAPIFWGLDRLGMPDWIAQRLWLGTLTFLAVVGARWLFLQLGPGRAGALAGALIYGFTPYQLAFTARMSVLLVPWVALPWIVGLTMRATRDRDWRAPAGIGVVLLLAGGINASSLLLVGVAPLLWLVLEGFRGHPRAVLASAGRLVLVSVGVSAWWLVGLRLQGRYGLPVLQLTENLATVAEWSTPGDVLRGLGNWFFYGRDLSGFSLEQASVYLRDPLVLVLTYAVPVVGLVVALLLRWSYRVYFSLLVLVGTVISVGSWPFEDPTPYGRAWKVFTTETSLGLAFRNSPRAVPLIVLGLAGLCAAGVAAIPRRSWTRAGAAAVAVLAVGVLLPVGQGGYLSAGQDRPEEIPSYWIEAVKSLDAGDHTTRILELPGSNFAGYRWGNLVDPLTPGLTDRPYLAREVLPYGTPASVNLLDALDRQAQLGVLDPLSIAPLARLLGVGTVSLRADLEDPARGFSPPPGPVWEALIHAPGLAPPQRYGPPGGDGQNPDLPSVALFGVESPRRIVRTAPTVGPVVLDGDGSGIVDAATAGLLDGHSLVLESAALSDKQVGEALAASAHLVLTDSNRRRIQTWFYALRDSRGHTERAGETAADPTGYDFRLDPFPGSTDNDRSVVEQVGGRVEVSGDGGPERPEDRGANAVDGDPATSWRVGGADPRGQFIVVAPDPAPRVDGVRLRQPSSARVGRAVRTARITVGDATPFTVVLGPESWEGSGQLVAIAPQSVARLRVEITGTTDGGGGDPQAPVGFAEIGIGTTVVSEVVRLPVDLLNRVGDDLDGHSLDVVLTRLRLFLPGTDRIDDEASLDRRFELPLNRSFRMQGTARTASGAPAVAGAECRDDLVEIDGVAVAVQLAAGLAPTVAFTACAPVTLAAGSHRVTAAPGALTGWNIDQIVLSTDADGEATTVAPRGPGIVAAPAVTITELGSSTVRAVVDAEGTPFWFVLGESASDGWTIAVDNGTVGERTLVDGYANGWVLTPRGPGPVTVSLRWTPQRLVGIGLASSGLAAIGCGIVLFRRRGGAMASGRAVPAFRSPFTASAQPWSRVAGAALVVSGGAFLVATPAVPMVVAAGLLTAVAGGIRRGRVVLVVVAPTALVASRVLEWPSVAWLSLVALAVELLLSRGEVSPPE